MSSQYDPVTAIHAAICEESLEDHLDPEWPGRCVKAAEAVAAELEKYKRGAKTLGEIIEKQCRDVLDVTGLHHLINEDGDGHWDAVWMRLFEMRDELADLKESTIGRERKRGDSWRDRAQESEARAQSLEVTLRRVRALRTFETVTNQELRNALNDCPPRTEGTKPHCPDCSGIVGETGIV